MKNFILIFITLVIFTGCNKDESVMKPDNDMIYRKVAWNSLTEYQKATVIHDWRESEVSKCYYWENDQNAICVTFNSKDDPLLGPIIVFIEEDTLKILGFGMRY